MPPIWDTLTRPGQPVAQSTQLFTQYPSGPPHTSPAYHDPRYGLRSWSRRSYVDPRMVSAMMGGNDDGGYGDSSNILDDDWSPGADFYVPVIVSTLVIVTLLHFAGVFKVFK